LSGERVFTREELRKYDGKGGNPQYLAFKGKVYDLTKSELWVDGEHMSQHNLFENLEETIHSAPHGEETLQKFQIVGRVAEEVPAKPAEVARALEPPAAASTPAGALTHAEAKAHHPETAPQKPDEGRRDFLKLATAVGGVATIAAVASTIKIIAYVPPQTIPTSWPRITVANISNVTPFTPLYFNYPLTNTPNILVKLGVKAENGVGPDGDIVAYSGICQHLGCFYKFLQPGSSPACNPSYSAQDSIGYCCCHGSVYDFVNGGKVIGGPAPHPVPSVLLEYDAATGNISAVGMSPPTIFGHGPSGTSTPSLVLMYDMQGGTVVS
jgi:arsenite oxidase small subunit